MEINFIEYIDKAFIILIPILYIFGMMFKHNAKIDDRKIPFILLGISIIFALALSFKNLFESTYIVDTVTIITNAVIQAIIATGVTVFANQLYKQATKPSVHSKKNK